MKKSSNRKKIIAAIQARMGSTRLPGKVLKTINDKTMIECIWGRLRACQQVDQVVLATSTRPENDVLVEHAKSIGLPFYRGSEEDLVQRHGQTLKAFQGDALIRITADCPLIDPLLVDRMAAFYKEHPDSFDLITNIFPRSFPKGLDAEILPLATLQRLDKEAQDPHYRELLTYYIMEHPQKFRINNVSCQENLSELRWTVDYAEDLEFVRAIYATLQPQKEMFDMNDILIYLHNNPPVATINAKWIGA